MLQYFGPRQTAMSRFMGSSDRTAMTFVLDEAAVLAKNELGNPGFGEMV